MRGAIGNQYLSGCMDGKIQYLNTDLDLIGPEDLTPLADALAARGVFPLSPPAGADDGRWHCTLEIEDCVAGPGYDPEYTIRVMLAAIEGVLGPKGDARAAAQWQSCTLREFNIGYDCGAEPWAFNQGLSNDTLRQIAACGGTLRWTLYTVRE
jgi:hypothetical protein